MKKLQPVSVLSALGLFAGSLAFAQNYQTMTVQSGFNEDVIANGTGTSASSTTTILDGDSFVFVAKDFLLNSGSTPINYGVPVDGIINSVVATTPGLSYQLGSLSGSNSLRLSNANLSGTLQFTTPKAATKLYMLSTSGSAESTLTVTVNFADGTTQQATGIVVPDWYGGSGFAVQGLGRISRVTDILDAASGTNPRMYQAAINIDAANQAKPIQSVTVIKTSTSNGFPNIFAFSADVYSDCVPPVLQAVTNIAQDGATVNWTASTSPTSSYSVYYSTSSATPSSTATPQLTNISGTSTPIGGLLPNTTYYFWVKTNCTTATGQSFWSFAGNFKTLCGPMTSMFENFDSYATGSIVPDCWVRIITTNGSQTINATSPASGTRNIYQYSGTTQNPTVVVLPEFSNVNAGTHRLRFKTRVGSSGGVLNVGYVTNVADAGTFNVIQSLNVNNTSYASAEAERYINVPSTVPANARLAIMNTPDAKSYYWDDVYWEAIPSCLPPTAVTSSNITQTGADISWTAPSAAPASGYEYYYSNSNTDPLATTTPSGTTLAGATSATLGSLVSNTMYYVWVRSACSASDKSAWTYVASFKTLCGSVTDFFENFDSYATGAIVPDCWVRLVGATGSMTISSTTPASGTRHIYQYSSSTQLPSAVVLPVLSNVNAGTHWLRFKARTSSATGTLNVGYLTDPADMGTFVLIQAVSLNNTAYDSNSEYTVVVPSTVPANARLTFMNTADGKSYYYDDVAWEAFPSCIKPSAVAATSITETTATLGWTAPFMAPANGYEYYYDITNTAPTATTTAVGTTGAGVVSTPVGGLQSNTTYYVWVRSVCSATSKSEWTLAYSFKTLCATMSSMFENFDSYATGSIVPDCWDRLAGTGSQTITATSPASGTRNIFQTTATTATPTYAVLPSFSNVNAGTHQLRFKARCTSSAGGTLNVGYLTDINDASTFNVIQAVTINNTTYTAANAEYTVTVPSTLPANARLAIASSRDGKSYYWDDIYWESSTLGTQESVGKKNITVYPNPFSDVLFISDIKNVETIKVFDVAGRVVKVLDAPSKEINLSSLKSGMYLVTLYFKDGSQNVVKAIKK